MQNNGFGYSVNIRKSITLTPRKYEEYRIHQRLQSAFWAFLANLIQLIFVWNRQEFESISNGLLWITWKLNERRLLILYQMCRSLVESYTGGQNETRQTQQSYTKNNLSFGIEICKSESFYDLGWIEINITLSLEPHFLWFFVFGHFFYFHF